MKKKHILSLFLCTVLTSFASCQEHEKVIDKSLKVGNIYCADGTTVPVGDFAGYDRQAIGVVVAVGTPKDSWSALVMGLKDLDYPEIYADSLYDISNVSSDLSAFDGKSNTSSLLAEAVETPELSPEAAFAASRYTEGGISGWHLPSVAEFNSAVKNRYAVEHSLREAGGEPFNDVWYHTSTVDGSSMTTSVNYNYCIIMPEGRVVSSIKNDSHYIRPFMILMKPGQPVAEDKGNEQK